MSERIQLPTAIWRLQYNLLGGNRRMIGVTGVYAQAIARGCLRAGMPRWTPNQLRHTAATTLREQSGLEAAWAVLGHDRPDTTLIYAERQQSLARDIAMNVG